MLLLLPQLILVPFLISTIGESGYGFYALIWSSLISIEQLLNSLQQGVVKYSAGYLACDDMQKTNALVSSSFVFSLMLSVGVFITALLMVTMKTGDGSSLSLSWMFIGVAGLFILPMFPYIAVIHAKQRRFVSAMADTASRYLGLVAIVCWFSLVSPSVTAVVVILIVALIISRLVQVPVAYRLVPGLQIQFNLLDKASFKLITGFGIISVVGALCLILNSTGIRWLVAGLESTSFVAALAIMLMPAMLLGQIVSDATSTVMPASAAYHEAGNMSMLHELMIRGVRYTTIVVLAGVFVATALMNKILELWVGLDYVYLAPFALTLFVSTSFLLSTSICHHMLKGMGLVKSVVLIYFIGLVVIPFSVILIGNYFGGDTNIVVTMGLSFGHLGCGIMQLIYCARVLEVSFKELIFRSYFQPVVAVGVCSVIGALLVDRLNSQNLYNLIAICGCFLLILVFFCFFIIGSDTEKQEVKEVLAMLTRRNSKVIE